MSDETFQCFNCQKEDLEGSEIVTLSCKHSYCWICMNLHINDNLAAEIKCPNENCSNIIHDSIIRRSLPDFKIDEYEYKLVSFALKNENESFKCLLPECVNFGFVNKNMQFQCDSCFLFNCVNCKATHPFHNCSEYQEIKKSSLNSEKSKKILKEIEDEEFTQARNKLKKLERNQFNEYIQKVENLNYMSNTESFTCKTCTKVICKGDGVKLRNCFHNFCKNCLNDHIINSYNIPVNCMENECKAKLQSREIRGILSKSDYEKYENKCFTSAKSVLPNPYNCKKPNCTFYTINNGNLNNFICPSCKSENCVKCKVIHEPKVTCEMYQLSKGCRDEKDLNIKYIKKEIKEGRLMKCPACTTGISKISGCNLVKCPNCKLEVCWILKIARWGPKGKGDTSGGCRCLVDGKACHPTCVLGCIPDD